MLSTLMTLVLAGPVVQLEIDAAAAAPPERERMLAAARSSLEAGGLAVGDTGERVLVLVEPVGPDHRIRVDVRVDDGGPIAEAEGTCELCGASELRQMVADLAAAVATRLTSKATIGHLRVDGDPPGATVFVDGERQGTAPLEIELGAGTHLVEVRRPGFESAGFEWQSVAGVRESFTYQMRAKAETADSEPRAPSKALWWSGWAALAVGGSAVGAGAGLWALDGGSHQPSCAEDLVDVNGVCAKEFDTKHAGIALLIGGGVAMAASIPLLVVGAKHRRTTVGLGPGSISLRGRF